MHASPQLSYDQVPYPSLSHRVTHPDQLATLATLLGMEPAPIERCRLLALGCAGGGNIIPMGYTLPESEFVGVDISAAQIEQGRQVVSVLGLTNVRLECMDIADITSDFGEFDYIIAHGVYAWVPADVREHILRVCKENLAPQGVAYVSYNALPGWHMRRIIRDAMLYHTRNTSTPRERAREARAIVDFLAEHASSANEAYGRFLESYVELLRSELTRTGRRGDAFILHDELEPINEPLYFYQFMERAQAHGLQYLVEAVFPRVLPANSSSEASETIASMASNTIEGEQYLDFLQNRTFRRTLLCHDDVTVRRSLAPESVQSLYVSAAARAVSDDPNVQTRSVERFRGEDGATLSTDHPTSKAAMLYLREIFPRAVSFDELATVARERAGTGAGDPAQDRLVLSANLLRAFSYSVHLVELHAFAPDFCLDVSERPVASPIARIQAQSDEYVTNLWHQRILLDDFERSLLQYLDGDHDRPALIRAMTRLVEEGVLSAEQEDGAHDTTAMRRLVKAQVGRSLRALARGALLVG